MDVNKFKILRITYISIIISFVLISFLLINELDKQRDMYDDYIYNITEYNSEIIDSHNDMVRASIIQSTSISHLNEELYTQKVLINDLRNNVTLLNKHIKDLESNDLNIIAEAREDFASTRTWSKEYDCSSYSRDFTKLIKSEYDIELFKINAFETGKTTGHAFNCIPYDPQTGVVKNLTWDTYTFVRLSGEVLQG